MRREEPKTMSYFAFTLSCWLVLWVYWTIMSRGNKRTVYRQSYVRRVINSTAIVSSYLLVYSPHLSIGWLGLRVLPKNDIIQLAGALACAVGAAFAIWARRTIGRNWSGIITVKQDHELMETGPYGLVRHPIYTGLLLTMLGSAVVLGEFRGLLAFGLMALAFTRKMGEEERLMKTQFPVEYPQYQERVKRLIPFVF